MRAVRWGLVLLTTVALTTVTVASGSASDARSGPAPQIGVDVVADRPNNVTVHYEVQNMPGNARVVLERRDTPKGRFVIVDMAVGTPGDLVDEDPVDRPATYRVVLQGPRGLLLASQDAGRVG